MAISVFQFWVMSEGNMDISLACIRDFPKKINKFDRSLYYNNLINNEYVSMIQMSDIVKAISQWIPYSKNLLINWERRNNADINNTIIHNIMLTIDW